MRTDHRLLVMFLAFVYLGAAGGTIIATHVNPFGSPDYLAGLYAAVAAILTVAGWRGGRGE